MNYGISTGVNNFSTDIIASSGLLFPQIVKKKKKKVINLKIQSGALNNCHNNGIVNALRRYIVIITVSGEVAVKLERCRIAEH